MTKSKQFVSLFSNKNAPFDVDGLAKLIDKAYEEDTHKTEHLTKTSFAPSTLFWTGGPGACPRYWYLAFKGAEFVKDPDPKSSDNMESGTHAHERIQKKLRAIEGLVDSNVKVEIERNLRNQDPPINSYVDVIFHNFNGESIVVEIKTTRTEAFAYLKAKNQGREYQEMQLLLYMYLLEIDKGALLYEDKNDHEKLTIPVLMTEENKRKIERVIEWLRMIYDNNKNGELPKKPYRKNAKVCKGCPIRKWCQDQPEGTIKLATLSYSDEDDE